MREDIDNIRPGKDDVRQVRRPKSIDDIAVDRSLSFEWKRRLSEFKGWIRRMFPRIRSRMLDRDMKRYGLD